MLPLGERLLRIILLGDAELPAGVEHGQAFAGVELNRSQMLNNLFGSLPVLGHDPDLPGCGPVSHSPWTKFARAGQGQYVTLCQEDARYADREPARRVF